MLELGKALSKGLRSKADFLLEAIPERFGNSFEKNKQVLRELGIPFTKLNRNLVAGYLTHRMQMKKA